MHQWLYTYVLPLNFWTNVYISRRVNGSSFFTNRSSRVYLFNKRLMVFGATTHQYDGRSVVNPMGTSIFAYIRPLGGTFIVLKSVDTRSSMKRMLQYQL